LILRNIFFAIFIFIYGVAQAQTLWGGTRYGMTVNQVKSVVRNTSSPINPDELSDGAQELLRVNNIKIVNKSFNGSFFFKSGKLTQVTLSIEQIDDFNDAILVFDSLTEVLRSKYGNEVSREIKRGPVNSAGATWMAGRTNLVVSAFGIAGNPSSIDVVYQLRIAQEADKL
jgi:hypothetical protein